MSKQITQHFTLTKLLIQIQIFTPYIQIQICSSDSEHLNKQTKPSLFKLDIIYMESEQIYLFLPNQNNETNHVGQHQ
jgi:hypothetical protein